MLKRSVPPKEQRVNFYQEMLTGGLVPRLLEPTKSRFPRSALEQRASTYTPFSDWHLHLDAMDVFALAQRSTPGQNEDLVRIAAARLKCVLHQQWNVATGTVYSAFSSDLSLDLPEMTEQEKIDCQSVLNRFSPPMFETVLSFPPRPRFDSVVEAAEFTPWHVHKTLLALAGDVGLLRADRLQAWALAMASATFLLASHVVLDLNSPPSLHHFSADHVFLRALEELLFRVELDGGETLDLLDAIRKMGRFSWTPLSLDKLFEARSVYGDQMLRHGIPAATVEALLINRYEVTPSTFRPASA